MKGGARIAAGVGIGYMLGRTHKMRLALMLAGAGLSGRLPGTPQELMKRGVSALGSSPELSKITESVRGELLGAARAAAVTAASNQIDSLNERLQQGGGLLRSKRSTKSEDEDYEEPQDEYDEDEQGAYEDEPTDEEETSEEDTGDEGTGEEASGEEDTEDAEAEEERKPAKKRPPARRRTSESASSTRSRSAPRRKKSDEDDEQAPKPRRRSSRTESSASGRAPVRRTRS
ncbi:hypothetical protein ACWDUD_07190 [Rhodococcus sp. NPDC003382]